MVIFNKEMYIWLLSSYKGMSGMFKWPGRGKGRVFVWVVEIISGRCGCVCVCLCEWGQKVPCAYAVLTAVHRGLEPYVKFTLCFTLRPTSKPDLV